MDQKTPIVLPLRPAAKKAGVSYDYLRKLCLENRIVHVRAGKKFLVNWENLVAFLNKGEA